MSKTREKRPVIQGINREKCEEAFGTYAKADAKLQQITAKMDGELTKIREKYQEDIAKLNQQIKDSGDIIEVFAKEHKEELFSKKKSIELAHGKIGFRTGTPAIKTLKGFTWASVTELLKQFLPDYVRTKEEANKEALLADYDNVLEPKDENDPLAKIPEADRPTLETMFPKIGIKIEQDESFFIEPKKEVTEVAQ